ncbi:MAG: hypothetical protein AAFO29_19430 [Actinomycetota bacterium]
MTCIIGVDPGLSGAIALLDHLGELISVNDMPVIDGRVTAALLNVWSNEHAITGPKPVVGIEFVHSMPKQGVASSFKFGASWGLVHGYFGGAGHRVIDVRPQDWKKRFHLGKDKEKARRLAIERWPDHAQAFARKKDAGRAEAALIAEHVRQLLATENGQPTTTETRPCPES